MIREHWISLILSERRFRELRTPLNAILGYTDLLDLEMAAPIPQEARTFVERIRLSARHPVQLIEDLLTFNRIEAGREVAAVESVELRSLFDDVTTITTAAGGAERASSHRLDRGRSARDDQDGSAQAAADTHQFDRQCDQVH